VSKITNIFKRLTYRPEVSRLVWRFQLAGVLRTLYYRLNRPPGNVMHVEVGEIAAEFKVHTPWELRALESAGGIGGEQHILESLLPRLRPGEVVYDIGSNFGIFTVLFAKAVGPGGTVVAFEPETHAHDHLLENLSLNGFNNVRAYRVALDAQNGAAKLFQGEVTGASSLAGDRAKDRTYQMVEVAEGDRLVLTQKLPVPRLVKIDVEGNEYAVIWGLRHTLAQPECELVCCEIHPQLLPAERKPEEIVELLKSLGFTQVDIVRRGTTEYHAIASKP